MHILSSSRVWRFTMSLLTRPLHPISSVQLSSHNLFPCDSAARYLPYGTAGVLCTSPKMCYGDPMAPNLLAMTFKAFPTSLQATTATHQPQRSWQVHHAALCLRTCNRPFSPGHLLSLPCAGRTISFDWWCQNSDSGD